MAISLPVLEPAPPADGRKPGWLKVRAPGGPNYIRLQSLIHVHNLHTVFEEAHCPNIGDSLQVGTKTFSRGTKTRRRCGVGMSWPTTAAHWSDSSGSSGGRGRRRRSCRQRTASSWVSARPDTSWSRRWGTSGGSTYVSPRSVSTCDP